MLVNKVSLNAIIGWDICDSAWFSTGSEILLDGMVYAKGTEFGDDVFLEKMSSCPDSVCSAVENMNYMFQMSN